MRQQGKKAVVIFVLNLGNMKPSYIAGFYFAMVSVPTNHFFGYFRSFLFHEPFLGFLNFSYAIIDPYYKRKSYLEICEVYFWTATITNWNHLLKDDLYKEVLLVTCVHSVKENWLMYLPLPRKLSGCPITYTLSGAPIN